METVESYSFMPGQCFICGSSSGPAVDTLRDLDGDQYDARLYICHVCAGDMASRFGWMPEAKVKAIKSENRRLLRQRDEAVAALASAREFVIGAFADAEAEAGAA
jgi:hypothetical protein